MDHADREAEDASWRAKMRYPPSDVLLLEAERLGGENRVGLGFGFGAKPVHEARELAVAKPTVLAGRQMVCGRLIELAAALGDVTLKQPILVKMTRARGHGLPPSRPRSFLAARNRWTRTVDSFNPVMTLTSRGVRSPK
jgi:hypothetical protein